MHKSRYVGKQQIAMSKGRQTVLTVALLQNKAVAHAFDLPEGTFGHAYAKFMGDRNFTAGDRPPVRFIDDIQLAYVAARAREVHDFWHVLFGCHTNVFGELALKAVELVQVPDSQPQLCCLYCLAQSCCPASSCSHSQNS